MDLATFTKYFFPAFGATLVGCTVFGLLKLTPSRALKHPLNMPFAPIVDAIKGRSYSSFQIARFSLGVAMGAGYAYAGWVGGSVLASHPSLENYATGLLLPWGIVAAVLHTQMTWERAANGIQIGNPKILLVCIACQSVFAFYNLKWMNAVADAVGDAAFPILVGSGIGTGSIILTNILRLSALASSGFSISKFSKDFFEPAVQDAKSQ